MEKSLDFIGYPTYSILSNGTVRDLRTGNTHIGHFHAGYRQINLVNPQGKKGYLVHRLVGLAFIENPENKPEIDHINRQKDDNRVENLRWVDDFEQINNRGDFKNNKLGEKYICCEGSSYRVQITRNDIQFKKRFKTLNDAVKARDEFLATLTS